MIIAVLIFVSYLAAASIAVFGFWVMQIRFGDVSDLDPNSPLVRAFAKKKKEPVIAYSSEPERAIKSEINSLLRRKFYGGGLPMRAEMLKGTIEHLTQSRLDQHRRVLANPAPDYSEMSEKHERYSEIVEAVRKALELHDQAKRQDQDAEPAGTSIHHFSSGPEESRFRNLLDQGSSGAIRPN
jgi:hypothetical protein